MKIYSSRTSRDDEKVPGGSWNNESTAAASTVLQSHSSSDSGLTVILDSPAMVFQPTAERQRSRDSNAETFRNTCNISLNSSMVMKHSNRAV